MDGDENRRESISLRGRTAEERAFGYQMDILRAEIKLIDQAIARCDEHQRATRNWAVVIWTGSIALALSSSDLKRYVIATAAIPVLFWLVDARWLRVMRRMLFRQRRISSFLNSGEFVESFRKNHLQGLVLLDPSGRQYKATCEYKKATGFWRTLFGYAEVSAFYIGLLILSIALGLFFVLRP